MRQIWNNILFWVETHLTIPHFKVVKEAWDGKAFDSGYLLRLEQTKLREIKEYMIQSEYFDHDFNIKWIDKCISLLEIMLEDYDIDWRHKKVNARNIKRFVILPKESTWESIEEHVKKCPWDLYELKAAHLYYEIRKRYTMFWWD